MHRHEELSKRRARLNASQHGLLFIGAEPYDDRFWLSAISFDGIDWIEINIVNDYPRFSFEDGEDLLSVNLYALSRNPRCPTCTGQLVSPEEAS